MVSKMELLTEQQVSEWTGVSLSTLRRMRTKNCKDPIPFTKIGGSVRYRKELVEKWLERNTHFDDASAREARKGA